MNFFKTSMLALVAVTMLANSRPAKAWAGVLSLNPALTLGGLALGTAGAAGGVYSLFKISEVRSNVGQTLLGLGMLASSAAIFVGVIAFDEQQDASFATISAAQAQKIGLTAAEMDSYNTEIEQVNALAGHVDSQLGSLSQPTLEDSAALWATVESAVAPETFSAMQKISVLSFK